MKWLVRIFLPLSLILFCDLALTANSLQDRDIFGYTSATHVSLKADKGTKFTSKHKHKNHHNVPDEELKDDTDESSTNKKLSAHDDFSSHFFYTRVAAINGHYLKSCFCLSRCIQYPASNKLYRSISVFRI
ncbi:hypothetical protein [Mucilaginibacter aquatilis]|uniref:Uncharacterized protein n=1 Tax=Mucilaginibacter aquatilis TaxID=1517760 RepID=A0A6I4IQR8_9SPHI|nr:hypothetical protein [Mucilaginibacter aquatilis]MVN91614.1 hypothetical protein [Mucilaginibacter aquatilis]